MTHRVVALLLAAAVGAPDVAEAQIPLPTVSATRSKRQRDPIKQAKARIEALQAQYVAIEPLKNWAFTTKHDLQRLYSASLANLKQARLAMARGKGLAAPASPGAFEVDGLRVAATRRYPHYAGSRVAEVPPDDFHLHVRVHYPQAWLKEAKRRVRFSWYIFDNRYLPMASTMQKASQAIYYASAMSRPITKRVVTYTQRISGLGLLPGRYFAVAVLYASGGTTRVRTRPVSLAIFRVKQRPRAGVKVMLPHHRMWYSSFRPKVGLGSVKAKSARGALVVSGKLVRADFVRGVPPAYVEVAVNTGGVYRTLYRAKTPLKRALTKIRAKIADHGLMPGTHRLRVAVYTEHDAGHRFNKRLTGRKRMKGTRTETKVTVMLR